MSKAFTKLKRRGLRTSLARFLSILGIVAIGTGFLAGLLATGPAMLLTVDQYFDENRLHDVDIKGTLGVTEDDVAYLRALDGVETVMPARVTDLLMDDDGGKEYVVRLYGVPMENRGTEGFLNDFVLVGGRLPEKRDEVAMLSSDWLGASEALGATFTIAPDNKDYEDRADTYAVDTFTVVGFVHSPNHMTVENEASGVGSGSVDLFFYAPEACYSMEPYTDAYVTVRGAMALNAFDDDYAALVERLTARLEDVGTERSVLRYAEVKDEAQEEIDDAQQEIDDAQKELDQASADAETDIADAHQKIDDAKVELEDAKVDFADGEKKYKSGLSKYYSARSDIRSEIAAQRAALDSQRAGMPYEMYANLKEEIDKAEDSAYSQLERTRYKLYEAEADLEDGQIQIAEAEHKLSKAEEDLAQAEIDADAEIADAQQKLDDAQVELNDAQKELDDLEEPEWIVLDREDVVSFTSYRSNTEKIDAIARVFPIFLFLVAALVALTTMTRMVEEERTQIGTLKALGYGSRRILFYYLGYSMWASVLGSALGMTLGFWLLPRTISQAYNMMYTIPRIIILFRWDIAALILPAAVLCTSGATLWACLSIMREKPARMMLPRAPEAGKRIFLEYVPFLWKPLKFTSKVTCRNIFRYKKRLYMTVLGIAGCTALLITGFGLRDSINDIVDKQFSELYQFDMTVLLKDDADFAHSPALSAFFADPDKVESYALMHVETGYVSNAQGEGEVDLYVPDETDKLKEHIVLRDRLTGADVAFNEDALVLTEKLCETLSVTVGEEVTVRNNDGKTASLTVTGITENYVTAYAFMSKSMYERAFGEAPAFDRVLAKASQTGVTEEALASELLKNDDVSYVTFTSTIKESFDNIVSNINYIVYVLILAAGALAVIVLYNLTNINVSERKKELATIKVLGFYEPEVARYVYRETNILSCIGIVVGYLFGYWLHAFVVRTAEVDAVMFGRTLYLKSFVLATAVTLLFTLLVDLLMLPKIKGIDMVESMKAND